MKRSIGLVVTATMAASGLAGCAGSTAARPEAGGATVNCSYPVHGNPARPVDPPNASGVASTGTLEYTLQMAAGTVRLTLDRAKAPCTVNSFASLAQQGFYDGTKCHRLVEQGIFILQCGDPTGTGAGTPGYAYADEVGSDQTYPSGTVAMANAGPDTNGSQFFLVWADTPLPAKYTVFGTMDAESTKVIAGIAGQGVDAADGMSPIADATIRQVTAG